MGLDARNITVSSKPKRQIIFEVNDEEAKQVADDLERLLGVSEVQGTPGQSTLRRIYAPFKAVADGREYGGH